jgi:hypothetical protein
VSVIAVYFDKAAFLSSKTLNASHKTMSSDTSNAVPAAAINEDEAIAQGDTGKFKLILSILRQ